MLKAALVALALTLSCAPDDLQFASAAASINKGSISFGQTVAGNITQGNADAYSLTAQAGDTAMLTVVSATLVGQINVFDPQRAQVASGRMTLTVALAQDGKYLIIVSGRGGSVGAYSLSVVCSSGPCSMNAGGGSVPADFAATRISQADIDAGRFSAADLFNIGEFLFNHDFQLDEGWGNGLAGAAPPNLRRIQRGSFGGPDSNNCVGCHNVGRIATTNDGMSVFGDDGAGDDQTNALVNGDGETLDSALPRNPPQMIGGGAVQQLASEMSAELQGELSTARSHAMSTGQITTTSLSAKGIPFGTITVRSNGFVDTSQVAGVDADLVIKPFGWKGDVPSLRRFIEGALEVHVGMQSDTLIARHCASPIPETVGDGFDCMDPDQDGKKNEITEGQLTAFALYAALIQVPVRVMAPSPGRAMRGEQLFTQVGCATCHVPQLELQDTTHFEFSDTTSGLPMVVDLIEDAHAPKLQDVSGRVMVELFSDLKRHDMGPGLAERHASGAVGPSVFITRPLWGVAASPPYLHDGRVATLNSAILSHGGEASAAVAGYRGLNGDDQKKLVEFLQTLGRDADHLTD